MMHHLKMKTYSLDLREKIVAAVRGGMSKAQAARTFGVGATSVKRYVKLAEEGKSLSPGKAPGRKGKLGGSGMKLLEEDLHDRPAVTYEKRADLLCELLGVRVSKSTICRMVGRLGYTRKRIGGCCRKRRMAQSGLEGDGSPSGRPTQTCVRGRDGHEHLAFSTVRLCSKGEKDLRSGSAQPRGEHHALGEHELGGNGERRGDRRRAGCRVLPLRWGTWELTPYCIPFCRNLERYPTDDINSLPNYHSSAIKRESRKRAC
jgi:transposase